MIELVLFWSLVIGVSVPGIVVAIRALPAVDKLVVAGVKPWACDICSCFWISALVALTAMLISWDAHALLAAGPGYTCALLVLRLVQAPHAGTGPLPPLE